MTSLDSRSPSSSSEPKPPRTPENSESFGFLDRSLHRVDTWHQSKHKLKRMIQSPNSTLAAESVAESDGWIGEDGTFGEAKGKVATSSEPCS